jgi:hypothetical protein
MQLLQGLLIERLDRHRSDVWTAGRLDQRGGVCRIGLVASNVGAGILRRQKHHVVALTTQASGVMVGRTAGLHDDATGGTVHEESIEAGSAQALSLENMPAIIGQGEFEDVLCQIDTDSRSIHGGLLLLGLADAPHPAWHIDAELLRQEESISSLERTRER